MSRVHIRFVISLLVCVLALASQASALIKPQPQRAILPNGLRVVVQEDHSLPLVSCKLLFKVGPGVARPVAPGLVAVLARLLETAAPVGETRSAFLTELAKQGCHPPQVVDTAQGLILMIQGPSDSLDVALRSLRRLAFGQTFSREAFDRAKNLELQKARQRLQFPLSSGYLSDAIAPMLFEGLPMGARFFATQEEVGKLTLADVEKMYQEQCVSNNAALVVVGDVMACEIFKGLMPVYGDLTALPVAEAKPAPAYRERADEKSIVQPDAVCTASVVEKREYLDIKNTQVVIGFPAPALDDPDCAAASVWLIAMSHVNDSWLGRVNRHDFPKLSNLSAQYQPYVGKGTFLISFESPDVDVDVVVSGLLRKLSALWRVPPRDAELQRILANCKSIRSLKSEFRAVQGISLGIGELAGDFSLESSIWSAIENVSADDLARVARRMFTNGLCAVRIAHPISAKSRQNAVVQSANLDNGMQVVVKPYGGSDVVAVCLRVGEPGGSFRKPMKGLPELVFRMIEAQAGPEARDTQLARRLDEIGGLVHCQVIPGSGLYVVGYAGVDQYEALLQCLKSQVFAPVFDDKLLARLAAKVKSERETLLGQASVLMLEKFTALAFPGDEWKHSQVPPENVAATKLTEARDFLKTWVKPGNVLCTVVGNLDPADGLRQARAVFGDLSSTEGPTRSGGDGALLAGLEKTSEVEVRLPAGSAYLAGGYRLPPARASRHDPIPLDFITLGSLMHYLARSEDSLLQRELVQKGLAEAVEDVVFRHTHRASYLYFLVRVSPDKLEQCREELRRILRQVPETQITAEQVEIAGKVVPNMFLQKMESSWYHALTLAGFLAQGYQADFFEKLPEAFKQVKPEQISAAMREYARHYILITGRP
ncbi:MAG TPA: insulinase family protein [Candidatus Ozemobacteraceae bacterium]|nr:insulinase family protein [Candidatus Ozemobacteraceae bacterium]